MADVELWRVPSPSQPCAYCRQDVEKESLTSCRRCAAVYHDDCWRTNDRRCAIYACEPAAPPPSVPRHVRPPLQPPPLPRTRMNWSVLTPIGIIVVLNLVRFGMSGSRNTPPPRPHPVAPQILRQFERPQDLELLLDAREPVIPALPDDVAPLLEEAQALEDSATGLLELPRGPLGTEARSALRDTVVADLAALRRSLQLYRSCAAARRDPGLELHIERLASLAEQKRMLLLELVIQRRP